MVNAAVYTMYTTAITVKNKVIHRGVDTKTNDAKAQQTDAAIPKSSTKFFISEEVINEYCNIGKAYNYEKYYQ